MSHDFFKLNDKQQKRPKVNYRQYLHNSDEPQDDNSNDSPNALDVRLLVDDHVIRQRIRQTARTIRYYFS